MMAAAEARAAWQRTANRCIVQEDAKRAPKLACCPSSSSSSKPQVDTGPGDTANETDHPPAGFVPLNWNTSNSNLPPDTKWWLQLQPNFGHQKDFTYEQLNALEAELESLRAENVSGASKNIVHPPATGEDITHVDINKNTNTGFSLDPNWRVPATCVKNDSEAKMQELKSVSLNNKQQPLKHKDIGECWYKDEGLVDLDPIDQFISKQPDKLCFDMESPWIGSGKTEPWWRTVDKDELASLVAQKSLENIENCDLPPPQIMKVRRGPFTCLESFDHDGIFSPSLDPKANSGVCNPTEYTRGSPTCGFGEKGHSLYGSDNPFSYSGTNSHSSTNKDSAENRQTSESEPSKAELLEALRHSQTRAREAEKAAQEAYNEKEHIIKLFFKQASHLFAYKQWLQLLQLETICFQLKHKDHPISNFFPVTLPWMPYRQGKRGKHKGKKGKRSRYEFGKYAIAFALGVGLAGAGLLLGWTMGWLFTMV